jgi:GNAT superfamily N-acetyltransferase
MPQLLQIKKTTTADKDFQLLVTMLDHELWYELKEDQATYDPHNKVPDIKTAVVVYNSEEPVAIGCFKEFDKDTVEIKRMFVKKEFRGTGISKTVLQTLEEWARDNGYGHAVLETSIRFKTACNLYKSCGYNEMPKYGPYVDLPESICMRKSL